MTEIYDDVRWQEIRRTILLRDEYSCQACGCGTKTLQVHHKRYNRKGEIWDSAEEDLQTLCKDCHKRLGHHPKGGIWWKLPELKTHICLAVEHCPQCASESFEESGNFITCAECKAVLPVPRNTSPEFFCNAGMISLINRLLGVPINVVYLAGKMNSSYRDFLIGGRYSGVNHSYFWDIVRECIPKEDWESDFDWPVVPSAIFTREGFECLGFCGPYWVPGGNMECHGHNSGKVNHGTLETENIEDSGFLSVETVACLKNKKRPSIFRRCKDAIKKADLWFAWIDSPDVYGTLVELGQVNQMKLEEVRNGTRGKVIVVAFSNGLKESIRDDMWFGAEAADIRILADNPHDAWVELWSGKYEFGLQE